MRAARPTLALGLVCAGTLAGATAYATAADSITATCTPGPCGIWQPRAVQIDWSVDVPARTSDEGCGRETITAQGVHQRTCRAFTGLDVILATTVTVRIDTTPPNVTGVTLAPVANGLGWYTAPLTATFAGLDPGPAASVSGIASCSQVPFSGPDSANASVSGTCRDRAGNVSAPFIQTFRYDATPPGLGPVDAEVGDRMVRLQWSDAEAPVQITRSPGVGGEAASVLFTGNGRTFTDRRVKNRTAYTYAVSVSDPAGLVTSRQLAAMPVRAMLEPANLSTVTEPPRLRWSEVRNASYYNVQVFRRGKKILSVWPKTPGYRLKERWRYAGRTITLTDGDYRVFVWPGVGPFAQQRYGRIVGSVRFTKR